MTANPTKLRAVIVLSLGIVCLLLSAGLTAGCSDRYLHPKTGNTFREVIYRQARPMAKAPIQLTGEEAEIVMENLRITSRQTNSKQKSSDEVIKLQR